MLNGHTVKNALGESLSVRHGFVYHTDMQKAVTILLISSIREIRLTEAEKSKSLTNEELTKADHDVINYVNQLLEDKLGTNKSNSSN